MAYDRDVTYRQLDPILQQQFSERVTVSSGKICTVTWKMVEYVKIYFL